MKHLINMKGVQRKDFHHALVDTNHIIAETTGNRFLGCGLRPQHAKMTKPDY